MTPFLSLALGLSLTVILIGYLADLSAVNARINGANGLPMLVVSFLGSFIIAIVAVLFGGWAMLG